MKKQKPITLKRSEIRKATRRPQPPVEKRHGDKRRQEKYPPREEPEQSE